MKIHHTCVFESPLISMIAEQRVLGGLMRDNGALGKISPPLTELDFYRRGHFWVFGAMMELREAAEPFNIITIPELLKDWEVTDWVDEDISKLLKQLNKMPQSRNSIIASANIVRNVSASRHKSSSF